MLIRFLKIQLIAIILFTRTIQLLIQTTKRPTHITQEVMVPARPKLMFIYRIFPVYFCDFNLYFILKYTEISTNVHETTEFTSTFSLFST